MTAPSSGNASEEIHAAPSGTATGGEPDFAPSSRLREATSGKPLWIVRKGPRPISFGAWKATNFFKQAAPAKRPNAWFVSCACVKWINRRTARETNASGSDFGETGFQ